ncbi:MAG: WD40/YVTN/BNR-like repeat-containing protein [Propylenella sp.]
MTVESAAGLDPVLLSPGGTGVVRGGAPRDTLAVGTTDGVWFLKRGADGDWSLFRRGLAGTFVSALARAADGALVAGTHHFGVARSDDGGMSWRWINAGIDQFDIWVVKAERLDGHEVLFAGSMPARLYMSEDGGARWTERPALTQVATAGRWYFPPPPHLGHVKDIVVHEGAEVLVGIEVGALLRSADEGASFEELPVSTDVSDVDIHRVLVHPSRPDQILLATGWGLRLSEDRGRSWRELAALDINYPDAMVMHPDDSDLLFVSGARGYPPNWYQINRARPRLARSRDGGRTWERLLGGFPDGQRPTIGAMTLEAWDGGYALYAGDTDGQIFESRDGGDSWRIIFETGAVSKGEFYRGLMKGRPEMTDLDQLTFGQAGQRRIDTTKA